MNQTHKERPPANFLKDSQGVSVVLYLLDARAEVYVKKWVVFLVVRPSAIV